MDGVISNMIAGFQVAYPDVRIDQSFGYATGLMDQLAFGNIDLAICPMKDGTVLPYSVVFLQKHLKSLVALPIRIEHPERQPGLLRRIDRPERPDALRFRNDIKQQFAPLSHTIGARKRNTPWRK